VQGLSLLGDAARLRRVLVNLIDSVVRVTESGEIVVHIAAVPGTGGRSSWRRR
jgi:signal transduction histidine kinase